MSRIRHIGDKILHEVANPINLQDGELALIIEEIDFQLHGGGILGIASPQLGLAKE